MQYFAGAIALSILNKKYNIGDIIGMISFAWDVQFYVNRLPTATQVMAYKR